MRLLRAQLSSARAGHRRRTTQPTGKGLGPARTVSCGSLVDLATTLGLIAVLLALLGSGSARAAMSRSTEVPATGLPCDIYSAAGTPCVAAYSTVRILSSGYTGPLYRVTRASDNRLLDVFARAASGVAAAWAQARFCKGTRCTVTELFDQSGEGNNLAVAPGGAMSSPSRDLAASATALPVRIGGQRVYGLDVTPGVGYRDDLTRGIAIDGQPESMYMVTSAHGTNNRCCFDFGNAETSNQDDGDGHMDAINFSSRCVRPAPCYGSGPWVQADLENGLFQSNAGDSENPVNPSILDPFVTAMLENDGQDYFALMESNARAGGLTTSYAGILPNVPGSDYAPMQQEGGIVLGIGGDNSREGSGEFFEGAITAGVPSDAAANAVQADIVSAGYRGNHARSAQTRARRGQRSGQRRRDRKSIDMLSRGR